MNRPRKIELELDKFEKNYLTFDPFSGIDADLLKEGLEVFEKEIKPLIDEAKSNGYKPQAEKGRLVAFKVSMISSQLK